MNAPENLFRPVEGALLDLDSLQAIADAPDRMLSAWLDLSWPGASGLVLSGMEIEGEAASKGPPGTVRLDNNAEGIVVGPGTAVLTTTHGRRVQVRLDAPVQARWPTSRGIREPAVLVLKTEVEAVRLSDGPSGGLMAARERVTPVIGFVRPDQGHVAHVLPLAASTGNGIDWITDIRRVWQPDHANVRALLKRLDLLDALVWDAKQKGGAFDRQIQGRNWVQIQTIAATALQAARMALLTRVMSTNDRVRLLDGLFEQLNGTVDAAAAELLSLIGPTEGTDPYSAVGSSARKAAQ